ncbi:MAG: glycosyltransferase [Bacteroidota bacterium]
MEEQNIAHQVINIDKYGRKHGTALANLFYLVVNFVRHIFFVDLVMLNFSQRGSKIIAPFLYLIARTCRTKIAFRIFGGEAKVIFQSLIWRVIWKSTILNSDVVFLQTKELLDYFKGHSKNLQWLPTSRKHVKKQLSDISFQRRFVFLGQVKISKGILHIREAIEQLDSAYTIHIYGPIYEENLKFLAQKSYYKGFVEPSKVIETLKDYDVLILPTYYRGEGYPGVLIEAYSLGIPVITTNWRFIPEIVKDGETGILIEPKSTRSLVAAIQHFNAENYSAYSKKAFEYFNLFDADVVNDKLIRTLNAL